MGKYERSGDRRDRKDRSSSPRREGRSRRSSGDNFEDRPRRRSNSGDRSRGNFGNRPRGNFGDRPRRDSRSDVEMTQVTCSACGIECEVPFKPTSSKPLFCKDCFEKQDKGRPSNRNKDFDIINEKLDKIIKALDIE